MEDRTSWSCNDLGVSCVNYFVQSGRDGGQNIMDLMFKEGGRENIMDSEL